MDYTATMTRTELRQAISYIMYKKMKRKDTPEDAVTMAHLKKAFDERRYYHEQDAPTDLSGNS